MPRCMTRSVHIRPRQNDGSTYSSYINQMTTLSGTLNPTQSINLSTTTHHTTTVLRPFFRDHPHEPVPEENFWTSWCKGRLIEADTPTIRLGDTPSGLCSAHLYHLPIFFTGRMPFLPPNQQHQGTEGNNWQLLATNHKLLLLLHPFSGLFSRTTWISRHQKSKPFNHSGFYRSKRWQGGVASAGPYANHWHLAPDRKPCQYLTTQFLQAGCPSCHPTNSVKALKATNQP